MRTLPENSFGGAGRVFGFMENATGSNLASQYGAWTAFKALDLSRDGAALPGVNTSECLDDIQKYGLHVTDAHTRITERVA